MSISELPDRASLEYLKKLAKERLREQRTTDPEARLSDAQLSIVRDHGFPSWRALKAEVDRRSSSTVTAFFAACGAGDVEALRDLLDRDPGLVRAWTFILRSTDRRSSVFSIRMVWSSCSLNRSAHDF